jgi:hypothetical protein
MSSMNLKVVQIKSEGQIGVLLFENGQLQIRNWLTNKIILNIINVNQHIWRLQYMNYMLLIRDAYHALPANQHQFNCQPQPCTASLPYAVIVCGCHNQLCIYHVRFNEYELIKTIEMDKNTSITCMDWFRGD